MNACDSKRKPHVPENPTLILAETRRNTLPPPSGTAGIVEAARLSAPEQGERRLFAPKFVNAAEGTEACLQNLRALASRARGFTASKAPAADSALAKARGT